MRENPTDLEAQQRETETLESRDRARRKEQEDDLKWLMAHPSGRRIVARLLEETGVHRTSFHSSGSTMAFNEGRKHIGYFLTGELLEIAPDAYLKMLKEYRNE
jgi:hypothetical protein